MLLVNESHVAKYADKFLYYLLTRYPDSSYWLTTHCWQGENRAVDVLTPHFDERIVKLLHNVKPTEWGEFKTDAIDFSQPFLWFDDDLYPEEKAVLDRNNALKSHIMIDLSKNHLHLRDSLLNQTNLKS